MCLGTFGYSVNDHLNSSINCPSVSFRLSLSRLIDGDACQSMVAGVFQSGHLIVWDLSRGGASVLGDGEAQMCRLARWAEPDILLAGYQNGDVDVYQYKPAETKESLHMTHF